MRPCAAPPLMHQPGEQWMYNTGAQVLGVLLLQRATGQPLEAGVVARAGSAPVDRAQDDRARGWSLPRRPGRAGDVPAGLDVSESPHGEGYGPDDRSEEHTSETSLVDVEAGQEAPEGTAEV